ncbi:MAG: hypothetical protein SCH71_14320 [Desulfobulbaceae bacterium]|nr:hypothetical protein [Desulfobulbaceae bacterium]
MGPFENRLNWRIGYAACTIVFMAVMMYLSTSNFDMVHREYRRAAMRLQPARIEELAHQELVAECRREAKGSGLFLPDDPCLSRPAAVLEERREAVRERLVKEKNRVVRKLAMFYITFGIFFLVMPPLILYLVLSVFIWIFKSIK